MDVRPGGDFRAVMLLPDGNRIDWAGSYVEVEPPSHLAMTLTDQPGDDTGLPVLFDLEEVDGGTQLTIRQDRSDFTRRAGRGDDRRLQRLHRRHRARAREAAGLT